MNFSLNGNWHFDYLSDTPYTDSAEPLISPKSDSALLCPVPGYWEDLTDLFRTTALHTKLHWNPLYTLQRYPQAGYVPDMALPNPVGCFVYTKTFSLSELPAGDISLDFGGAQNTLSAWVNGAYLGRHEGYSTPFAFSVPASVLAVGENRITLAVSNNRLAGYMGKPVSGLTSRAANECTGGIYGDISLCIRTDGLRDVWVTVASDCAAFTVHTDGGEAVRREVKIYDGDALLCTAEIEAGSAAVTISSENMARWTPDSPKLYTAVVTTPNQQMSRRFGIRRLTVEGTKLYLNGEPYFFRGTCEHCYQPLTVHPTREKKYYRMVLRRLKELGFNSIRFHTWIPPEEYMEAADELGMLIEPESPNNTSYEEWKDIVRFCRRHTSVNLYSTGNELQIDTDYEEHLRACAALVHSETDSLFSPMSAMRGIEYHFLSTDPRSYEPFQHNPERLAVVDKFCDLYNSYSLALTSYSSSSGTHTVLDERNAIYKKPLLSHEICIHGTYCDFSLKDRYRGSRIGDTEFMSSAERHLEACGLLDRAPLYYRNSAAWQRILRKHCFETLRRCESFAGYDFLGDIDTHWHTFGYCVGMMNEFYELKPGETVQNVLRYNNATVLLADLPACVNFTAGARTEIPILVSHYGEEIQKALLQIRVSGDGKVLLRREVRLGTIERGKITNLYSLSMTLPRCETPMMLKLSVSLSGGNTDIENEWELYVFPRAAAKFPSAAALRGRNLHIIENCTGDELMKMMAAGERVVLFGTGPFASRDVSFQLSVAGRTNGHLATAIADHPLMCDFPHEGYCGKQFESMLNNSSSAVLDTVGMVHDPIIDIASSYKNAHREAMLAEYRVGRGKLLICTLRLTEDDPAARWLKARIIAYAMSDEFMPAQSLNAAQLAMLCTASPIKESGNDNEAMNKNDITM